MSHNPNFKSEEAWHAAIALVKAHGLDPHQISSNNIGEDGYDQFLIDVEGKRAIEPDPDSGLAFRVERHAWPEGFPFAELEALLA